VKAEPVKVEPVKVEPEMSAGSPEMRRRPRLAQR
jgi:hypothetical protein